MSTANVENLRSKMRSLLNYYKSAVQKSKSTGGTVTGPFMDQLKEIFG